MLRKITLSKSGEAELIEIPERPDRLLVEQAGKTYLDIPVGLRKWNTEGSYIDLSVQTPPIDLLESLEGNILAAIFYGFLQFILKQGELRLEQFGKRYTINKSQQRYQKNPRWFEVHDYARVVVPQGGKLDLLLAQLHNHWGEENLWNRLSGFLEYLGKFKTSKERINELFWALSDKDFEEFLRLDTLTLLYQTLKPREVEEVFLWLQTWKILNPLGAAVVQNREVPPFARPKLPAMLEAATLGINVWHRPRIRHNFPWPVEVYDLYAPEYEKG